MNSGVFSLEKQARFTLNFCSGMPLRKVHELTFLWFGLPGPLLMLGCARTPFATTHLSRFLTLSDPTEIPPSPNTRHLSHDPCHTVFSVVSQTIAAAPPLLSVRMAYRNPKTGLNRGVSSQKKLASEACRAIGGIA